MLSVEGDLKKYPRGLTPYNGFLGHPKIYPPTTHPKVTVTQLADMYLTDMGPTHTPCKHLWFANLWYQVNSLKMSLNWTAPSFIYHISISNSFLLLR